MAALYARIYAVSSVQCISIGSEIGGPSCDYLLTNFSLLSTIFLPLLALQEPDLGLMRLPAAPLSLEVVGVETTLRHALQLNLEGDRALLGSVQQSVLD